MEWECKNCTFTFEITYPDKFKIDEAKFYIICPHCEEPLGMETYFSGRAFKLTGPINGTGRYNAVEMFIGEI